MSGLFNNLIWFVGVVEDSNDLTNAGRVRVRAFGIHASDKEALPTAHLPWATVLDGTFGAAQVIPKEADWVFGFFVDGREAQHPMIMGRIPGMSLSFGAGAGMPGEDPYLPPETAHEFGKPPLHPYMCGEDAEFGSVIMQQAFQQSDVKQANDDTFDEPPVMTPVRNTNNTMLKSKNGDNFLLLCDPVNNEAGDFILLSHSSGSVFQIDPNGTIFIKSFGDTYDSTDGVKFTNVEGAHHTNITEDWTMRVETGSGKIWINGDMDIECENFNVKARNQINMNAAIKTNISGGGVGILSTSDDINMQSYGNIKNLCNPIGFGGYYVSAIAGDVHIDSAQMSLTSLTYTKIYSKGAPSISLRTLPYPDLGHLGIDIDSKTSVRMNSGITMNISSKLLGIDSLGALGIKSGATMDLHATGQLGLGASGLLNMDGSLVLIGNGTASATGGLATGTVTTVKAPQLLQSATSLAPLQFGIQETATCVAPGEIPASRPQLFGNSFVEKQNPATVSFESHDDERFQDS